MASNRSTRDNPWVPEVPEAPKYPHLYWLFNSAWICQAAYVAAELDIAEHLRHGPLSVTELAQRCDVKETPLRQVLRALAGFGIFEEDSEGKFALNMNARPLLRDDPYSVSAYATLWGNQLYPAAGELLEQVRTGEVGFKLHFGEDIYEVYEEQPKLNDMFRPYMNHCSDIHSNFIFKSYDFTPYSHVLDVGGGGGAFMAAMLKRNPHLEGTWCDRPEMFEQVRSFMNAEELSGRCELKPINFFEYIPSGADLYTIKDVLHDWEDESAINIVKKISEAMSEDSTLLIIEGVMDPSNNEDGLCKLRDLEQLLWTGGRVRTQDEFSQLIAPAGLEINQIIPTEIVDLSIIEIRKM